MTRFHPALMLAVSTVSCATLHVPADDEHFAAGTLGSIRTYWMGEHPPCAVHPLRAIAATSEDDLRRAAAQAGGNAGMRGGSSIAWPDRARGNSGVMVTPIRTYTGVAVVVGEHCHA